MASFLADPFYPTFSFRTMTFFLTLLFALVAHPRSSYWPGNFLFYIYIYACICYTYIVYLPLSVSLLCVFADDVKMVFPRSQTSRLISFLSSTWTWPMEWDLPIPNNCSCLNVRSLTLLSPSVFVASAKYSIPLAPWTRLRLVCALRRGFE